MRYFILLCICGAIGYAAWWGVDHYDEVSAYTTEWQKNEKPILTFEVSNTPDGIMQKHQKELLKTPNHAYGKAIVKFLPCVLYDVKYTKEDKRTEETKMIWSLESGEM